MKKIVFMLFIASLFACDNSDNYVNIYGEWECASWVNKQTNSDKCNNNVYFNFKEDKSYSSKLGAAEDTGKYKVTSNKLYAIPDGKMEIAVQISKSTPDTLELLMNLAGMEEILVLVRTQK